MAHTTAELRELFDLIDADRSGFLDRDEIQNLAGRLGKHLTAAQLDEAMDEMDQDGGGEVDFDEFVDWWTNTASKQRGVFAHGAPKLGQTMLRKDMTSAELRTVFLEIDTDGSGALDRGEVVALAQRLGHTLTDAQLSRAMSEMDSDGGGSVDFDEFKNWWQKFGSQRKTMFIVDADERLSHEMENRAVWQEDSDSTNIVGRSRAAKRREAMRALRAARWAVNFRHKESHGDADEVVPLSFWQRREALGPPPVRRIVTGPEGVRLGPAQKLMLERDQEVADCEFELATLDYQSRMNEIAADEQEEEVKSREAIVDKCNVKLEKIGEKEEQLAERWRINTEDVKLRQSLGAGRTMKLLEAEMDELDEEGDRLVQDRRMAEAEKNEKLRNRADAAEVHDAIREAGRELAWKRQAAQDRLAEVRAALERKNTIEKGVRDAEGALVEAEDSLLQWQTKRNQARLQTASTVKERETAQAKLTIVQEKIWAEKAEIRALGRKDKALDEQVAAQDKSVLAIENETESLKSGELEESDKLTQYKEELAWRERLQGDEQMTVKVREQIVESQEAMEKSRRRRTALFEKRKEINRERMKVEKQRMQLLEIRTPHQLEASKLEHQLKELQQLTAKLGAQYEAARALGIEADEKLKQGEEHLMACKRTLADEKRALEVAERKQKALEQKQEQVAAEAKVWRDKFNTEKAAADAEAAAEAAEKARIEEEKAEAEARRLRAIAEREAREAKEAEDARKLAALVAQAQQDAKRWTIGQRVRLKDGQVGTVANIRIAGATGLDWENRPGITVKLGDPDKFGDHGSVFVGPSEVMPFDYGTKRAAPVKKATELRLDRHGRRPLDGTPIAGVPVPIRAPGETFRSNLAPSKKRMGYTIHAGRRDSVDSLDALHTSARRESSALGHAATAFSALASSFASMRGGGVEEQDAGFDGFSGANSSFAQLAGQQRRRSAGRSSLSPLRHSFSSVGGFARPSSVGALRCSFDGSLATAARPHSVGGSRRKADVVDRLYPSGLDRSKDLPRIAKYLNSLGTGNA